MNLEILTRKNEVKFTHPLSRTSSDQLAGVSSSAPHTPKKLMKSLDLVKLNKFSIEENEAKKAKQKDFLKNGLYSLISTLKKLPIEDQFVSVDFEYTEKRKKSSENESGRIYRTVTVTQDEENNLLYQIKNPLYLDHLPYKIINHNKTMLLKAVLSNFMVHKKESNKVHVPVTYLMMYNQNALLLTGDDEKLSKTYNLYQIFKKHSKITDNNNNQSISMKLDTDKKLSLDYILIYKNYSCLVTAWKSDNLVLTEKSKIIQKQIMCLQKMTNIVETAIGDEYSDAIVELLEVQSGYHNPNWRFLDDNGAQNSSSNKNKNSNKPTKIKLDPKKTAKNSNQNQPLYIKRPLDFAIFKRCKNSDAAIFYKNSYDSNFIKEILDKNMNIKKFILSNNLLNVNDEDCLVTDFEKRFTIGVMNIGYEDYLVSILVIYDSPPPLIGDWKQVARQLLTACRI